MALRGHVLRITSASEAIIAPISYLLHFAKIGIVHNVLMQLQRDACDAY